MKTSWNSIEATLSKSPSLLPRHTSNHIRVSVVQYDEDFRIRVEANVSAGWRACKYGYGFSDQYNDPSTFFCKLFVGPRSNRLKHEASQFPAQLIAEYRDKVIDCTLRRGSLNVIVPWVDESEFWRESERGNLFLKHRADAIATQGGLEYSLNLIIVYLMSPGGVPFASAGLPGSGKRG